MLESLANGDALLTGDMLRMFSAEAAFSVALLLAALVLCRSAVLDEGEPVRRR